MSDLAIAPPVDWEDSPQMAATLKENAVVRLGQILAAACIAVLLAALPADASVMVRLKSTSDANVNSMKASSAGVVRSLKPMFSPADKKLAKKVGLDRWYIAEPALTGMSGKKRLLSALKSDPSVEVSEEAIPGFLAYVPNDPLFTGNNGQWNLRNTGQQLGAAGADIDMEKAWDLVTGGNPSIVIAVLDTGVQANHPDLAANMLPGRNVFSNNNNVNDANGHGTSCAGIAGAVANNGIGIAGIAFGCKILPVKVTNDSGSTNTNILANGIIWAADNGADVISMSIIYESDVQVVRDAINYALGKNVTIVAPMGNDYNGTVRYPAAIPETIAVGASDRLDRRTTFSNWGNHIDVVAPGITIPTTTINSGYTSFFVGTSAAVPHVAGSVALLLSHNPALTPAQVQQLIRDGAEDLRSAGWDQWTGYGRVNALRSIYLAMGQTFPSAPGTVTDTGDFTENPRQLSFTWTASTDPAQPIVSYEYAIGPADDPIYVHYWTSVGNLYSHLAKNMLLDPVQTYYIYVRARNALGVVGAGGQSNGIIAAAVVNNIGDALGYGDNSYMTFENKIVTAVFNDRTWITDAGRSSAVALAGATDLSVGDKLRLRGKMVTTGCFREMTDLTVHTVEPNNPVLPMFTQLKNVGGEMLFDYRAGITDGLGLYNIGQLVRVAGKVQSVGTGFFMLNDGSANPVKVVIPPAATMPATGAAVSITAVVECETSGTDVLPTLRLRDASELISED